MEVLEQQFVKSLDLYTIIALSLTIKPLIIPFVQGIPCLNLTKANERQLKCNTMSHLIITVKLNDILLGTGC